LSPNNIHADRMLNANKYQLSNNAARHLLSAREGKAHSEE